MTNVKNVKSEQQALKMDAEELARKMWAAVDWENNFPTGVTENVKSERHAFTMVEAQELIRKMSDACGWEKMFPPGVTQADVEKAFAIGAQSLASAANRGLGEEKE